ncbi:MAG: hypothetical protein NZ703_09330, partial [Gemmataceae bacterium]|nr:hypothetical protein [Gemmataceae bacterium]
MTLPQQLQQQGRCQVVRSDWSIAWGALTNWLAFLATLLTSFFLAPYLLERLGPSRYGVWCIVEAVLAYFTLFDLGIAACLVRYVARYHTLADLPLLNRYAASAFWLYSLLALVVLAISIPLSYKVATPLEQRLDTTDQVTPFMLLLLIQFAAGLPLSVFPTLLDGLQLFGWKSLVRLFALAGRVSGIVLVMEMQPGLLGLALVLSITQLAE